MSENYPTQDRLRELLDYNPDTGIFTWRPRPSEYFASDRSEKSFQARYEGKPAGSVNEKGSIVINVDGFPCHATRLAWLYVKGEFPARPLFHKDGNKKNNRLDNLREGLPGTTRCKSALVPRDLLRRVLDALPHLEGGDELVAEIHRHVPNPGVRDETP